MYSHVSYLLRRSDARELPPSGCSGQLPQLLLPILDTQGLKAIHQRLDQSVLLWARNPGGDGQLRLAGNHRRFVRHLQLGQTSSEACCLHGNLSGILIQCNQGVDDLVDGLLNTLNLPLPLDIQDFTEISPVRCPRCPSGIGDLLKPPFLMPALGGTGQLLIQLG